MVALSSDAIFAAIKEKVAADPAKAKSVNGVFLYKITKDGKVAKEWSKLKGKFDQRVKVQRLRELFIMQSVRCVNRGEKQTKKYKRRLKN